MAEIVTAYCASHAPMQAVDPESAPKHQADNFFAGLKARPRPGRAGASRRRS